jgi:hypothetical protein
VRALAIWRDFSYAAVMRRVFAILTVSLALAAGLGGCSKCDPWWGERPGACHSAVPAR